MLVDQVEHLKDKLKEVFGYGKFRGNQEVIIRNIMDGKNTFVIMPTGAGKSLCYQLPAVMHEGTAIVISPLIALMKNQVDQLNALGINAQFLNSTLTKAEMNRVKTQVINRDVKLLYVAPESLTKEENVAFLKQAYISFVAIDEAHCISEWGHDFRPEYRRIKSIIGQLGNLPIIALTATATPKVQLDIQRNLQMEEADLYKSSFNRENLYYEVRNKPKKTNDLQKQVIRYVKAHKNKSGIIYCLSRKKVEEVAYLLQVNDIKAAPYHAGLDASVRMKNQDDFLNEETDVIVATIAFGMGIDKPDVRFVVHYDTPKSLEGYYQETGRAGRDGLEGNCMMFYSYDDILKLEKFNKDKSVTERENGRILLQEMASFAESAVCRRRQLLHYFGEEYSLEEHPNCGMCDNCNHPKDQFEGQKYISQVLEAVVKTEQRFGLNHLVHVLRGVKDDYVQSYKHNTLDIFGQGSEEEEGLWISVIRQTLLYEFLQKDIENIGVLKITAKGLKFLEEPHSFMLMKDHDYLEMEEEANEAEASNAEGKSYDETLFDLLKKERKRLAKQKNLPPYVIFQDPSLEEMATTFPTTDQELAQINGVGQGKVVKFGRPFIRLIKSYVEENEIVTASDVVVKSSGIKSKIKIFIIQQIDRMVDLEEIAEAQNLKMEELIDEIEHICYAGTKLSLEYYIDQIMDDDRQDEVYEYFLNAESDNISEAHDQLGEEDYSEEELRLMRVKFLSEYAN
ncbi:MAG: DNA helicase RecQ [Cyclobacteriaceae bacterium]